MKQPRMRLMPVVITAAGALLALKLVGFATHSSAVFVPPAHAEAAPEPAAPPHGASAEAPKAERGAADAHGSNTAPAAASAPVSKDPAAAAIPDALREDASSERALLEALKKRRETLDARSAELDMRESLLAATQKKLEERLEELKRVEKAVSEADARRAEEEKARLKGLVTMYEGMKVKEAARIFEKLDPAVLLDVASAMNPRKLSDVLGQMSPDAAQRLTVSLARREPSAPAATAAVAELPKIEGRPTR